MDKRQETIKEEKEKMIRKGLEEAGILEKELARERQEEVSRMVKDLEEKASSCKKEEPENKEEKRTLSQREKEQRAEAMMKKISGNIQKEEDSREAGGIMGDGKSRKRKSSGKKAAVAAGIVAAGLAVAAGAYYLIGQKYRTAFLPGTVINGVSVSGMGPEEVKEIISTGISNYTLTIKERGDKTETITKDDMALKAEFDGSLEKIIERQNPYAWLPAMFSENSYEIETMISYEESMLEERISRLECLDEANVTKPMDAYVSDYVNGQGYTIVPEENGNELNPDLLRHKIEGAVENLRTEISLEEEGCYKEPSVKSDNEQLKAHADKLNQYVNVTVTYVFGDKKEVLNGDVIHEWLIPNNDVMDISLDRVKEYVQMLATKYNTAYRAKTLKTSYGDVVTITRGSYGWRIDQAAEAEQLLAILQSGESQEREPVYAQTAASHGENDYGDTYVEINLTAQHLFFYKEGKLLVESDFVSGNVSRGFTTPPGAYPLTYKERNATLRGQGYASPVSYWMPFNGGIGMHDAKWRSSFGGKIYRTNGSHGCINLPFAAAKTIYENISKGAPVLCYNLGGTETKAVTQTAAPPAETPPVQETPSSPETQPETAGASEPGLPLVEEPPAPQPTQPQPQPTQPSPQPQGPGAEVGNGQGEPQGPGIGL